MAGQLYLEVYSSDEVPLETLITLFVLKYCDNSAVEVNYVKSSKQNDSRSFFVSPLQIATGMAESLPCCLPAVVNKEESLTISGLCGTLRYVVKAAGEQFTELLGFRGGCLASCAEVSMWTKFCEVDMLETVKSFLSLEGCVIVDVPLDVVRYEGHLGQPVRLHNILKRKQELAKEGKVIEHTYSEGPDMTLSDVILFSCFYLLFKAFPDMITLVSRTRKWYEILSEMELFQETAQLLEGALQNSNFPNPVFTLPEVPDESLYKSDPKRYKPKNRIFTKQSDINDALQLVMCSGIPLQTVGTLENNPLDWESYPAAVHPLGGDLPLTRLQRKCEQLQNLIAATMSATVKGDVIVDFCSGGGHLGLLLAYLLPNCHIILVENKEESMNRARLRAAKLALSNIEFFQSNLDYFRGKFNIGISLHACGVATDLVMQQCVNNRAVFVSCPCCYGSIQPNHVLQYPRSHSFCDSPLSLKDYLVVSHAADQTHNGCAKTTQGQLCMQVVDTDRCIHARENNYIVQLYRMQPETCTPKNHILVGIPLERQIDCLTMNCGS